MSLSLISVGVCCNVRAYRIDIGAINEMETTMVFVVYLTEDVIGFVHHELQTVLDHIRKNKFHKLELWKRGRHVGGFYS